MPLRAFNGTERSLGIPLPVPGPNALRAIRQGVAWADVVHLHDALYPTNVAAFALARLAGKPVVLTQHIAAVPYRNPVPRMAMRAMNRLVVRPMLARADQAIFISNLTAQAFADVGYRRPPRMIFNGVDTEVFRPAADASEKASARRSFALSPDRPVALFVGRFVEKKGLSVLRQAAALGTEIDWVLAGWGPIDPAQWRLPNVVVHTGLDQAALAPLYRAADVFVLPSTGEGLPLVLQEALACGLPCVCGADTARADNRLTSLLAPVALDPGDVMRTANATLEAVRGATARSDADQSRRRFECMQAWYSWSSAARHYESVFERAVQETGLPKRSPEQHRPAAGIRP
jgi:glycosyltransferase involved in cell wall biosynthesis